MGSSKLIQSIKAIFEDQLLAVLSTREGDQPYSSLVCFAATDDLRCLIFATPRDTRKYANIEADCRVAMLVDNRANDAADIDKATAVTVLGTAREVRGEERGDLLARYLGRHPHLESFASSPATALFKVEADKYIVASRFQHVQELSMGR
jgi:nitroimidazol reductase NimA-like FMN-containing flavoprotein (pyridoxamine 5'-phosphate oxidase superfamily)